MTALNDSGAIKGLDAREDGVYITYVPSAGADPVTKKLGDVSFELTITSAYDNTTSDGLYVKKFIYKNGKWSGTDVSKSNGSGAAQGWMYINITSFKIID